MSNGLTEFLSMILAVTKKAQRKGKQVDPGVIFRGMEELTNAEAAELGIIYGVLKAFMKVYEVKIALYGGKN